MSWLIAITGPEVGAYHQVRRPPAGLEGQFCFIGRGLSSTRHFSLDRDGSISRSEHRKKKPHEAHEHLHEAQQSAHAIISSTEDGLTLTRGKALVPIWFIFDGTPDELSNEGDTVLMTSVFLCECGESAILFLDVEEKPSEVLLSDLCRGFGEIKSSVEMPHLRRDGVLTTVPGPVADEEGAVLLLLWQHVRGDLTRHGLGHLLPPT